VNNVLIAVKFKLEQQIFVVGVVLISLNIFMEKSLINRWENDTI